MDDARSRRRLSKVMSALDLPDDALARLEVLRGIREQVETLEADAVAEARRSGVTWKAIGALYGLTKQGAQQRFRTSSEADADG